MPRTILASVILALTPGGLAVASGAGEAASLATDETTVTVESSVEGAGETRPLSEIRGGTSTD